MRPTRKRNPPRRDIEDFEPEKVIVPVVEKAIVPAEVVSNKFDDSFQLIVEKILGRKFMKATEESEAEELFFIKWRGLSYLHVSWERRNDIERVDPQGKGKVKRFMQSPQAPGILGEIRKDKLSSTDIEDFDEEEVEYFHPDMAEVHRIISCSNPSVSHSKMNTLAELEAAAAMEGEDPEGHTQYLVKWRGLPYSDCSWENWDDLKQYCYEIFKFWRQQNPPSLTLFQSETSHPDLQEYQRLDESPNFCPSDPSAVLKLRDYQLEGVNWLLWNWWHKRACILADEMGLGKTIQSVCFLHQLQTMPSTRVRGPFLIVAPLSLINQWYNEISTWSPDMNCIIMHGSNTSREMIEKYEFYFQEPYVDKNTASDLLKSKILKFDILLTTFEIIIKDIKLLSKIKWKVLIIDEAHRLKNPVSRIFEHLIALPFDHCVLLTGTPLQNKTEELWALLHFADRQKFSNQADFVRKFGDLKDAAHVAQLHTVLKPYLLRRVKEDVEKSLPPKEETIIEVTLTPLQKQFYRAIYERNTAFLFKGAKTGNQPSLMNVMMELRKCCNHPYLLRGVEDRLLSELSVTQRQDDEVVFSKLIDNSGKLVLLNKLLPRLYEQGHKVLIFSQMVRVLNILEDFLRHKNYTFERLDGTTHAADRHMAVERFSNPSFKRFVMLLSTKAGGLGLNLTSADTVIIFDSDWNPHNDIQAQARAHRIGQMRPVMVYRLLTRKTYEMHMFHRASLKLGMDRAVLAHARNEQDEGASALSGLSNSKSSSSSKTSLQFKEIDELLKRGAYDIFRDDDTEQSEFVESDIDTIMQRRAHKVSYDGVNANSLSSSLGGFSKASFVSADESEDVDINDPDFWRKAVGLKDATSTGAAASMNLFDLNNMDLLPMQRRRKATTVFGSEEVNQVELDELLAEDGTSKGKGETSKVIKDSKIWGSHTRDRVLRTMLIFGFGRWEKIWKESGSSSREILEVEAFCRAHILQCGLLAVDQEPLKGDAEFVNETIQASKAVDALVKSGEREMDFPPILLEDKFVLKLKSGVARKTLNRLDILSKLFNTVSNAVDKSFQEITLPMPRPPELDAAVACLRVEDIAQRMLLGNLRPSWTRPIEWWDEECDRHLLVGVFIHGYGKFAELKEDSNLLFRNKINTLNNLQRVKLGYSSMNSTDPMSAEDAANLLPFLEGEVEYDSGNIPLLEGGFCKVTISHADRESQYRGVFPQPGSVRWLAQYGDAFSNIHLGIFDTEKEAALVYDESARKLEADNAMCNFNIDGSRNTICTSSVDATLKPSLPWHRGSKYRGVRSSGNRWTSQIACNGTVKHLGTFSTEIEAAYAYDAAAINHHGLAAATINFSQGVQPELDMLGKQPGVTIEYFDANGALLRVKTGSKSSTASKRSLSDVKDVTSCSSRTLSDVGIDSSDVCDIGDGGVDNENGDECADKDMGGDQEDGKLSQNSDPANATATSAAAALVAKGQNFTVMPDVRTLNRLFIWLLSPEAQKMIPPPKTEPEKPKKSSEKSSTKFPEEEETVKEDTLVKIGELELLSQLHEFLDVDAISMAYRKGALKQCENVFLSPAFPLPITTISSPTSPRATITNSTKVSHGKSLVFVENSSPMDVADAVPVESMESNSIPSDNLITEMLVDTTLLSERREVVEEAKEVRVALISEEHQSSMSAVDTSTASIVQENGDAIAALSREQVDEKTTTTITDDIVAIDASSHDITTATATSVESKGSDTTTPMIVSNEVTDEDFRRISCAFIVLGCPIDTEDENDNINNSIDNTNNMTELILLKTSVNGNSEATTTTTSTIYDINKISFTWEVFKKYLDLTWTIKELKEFYTNIWIPFCATVSRLDTSAFTMCKRLTPLPTKKPSENHPITKGLCHLFLQRQQIMKCIRFLLSYYHTECMEYLYSFGGSDVSGLPVWWCPWIHDIGLMMGCLKYGYLYMERICLDDTLPFTHSWLQDFIRKVFFIGPQTVATTGNDSTVTEQEAGTRTASNEDQKMKYIPFARGVFFNTLEEEHWVRHVSMLLPETKVVEARLVRILNELTSNILPLSHPFRVRTSLARLTHNHGEEEDAAAENNTSGSTITSTASTNPSQSKDKDKDRETERTIALKKRKLIEETEEDPVLTTVNKRSCLPLQRFLDETLFRRREALFNLHTILIDPPKP